MADSEIPPGNVLGAAGESPTVEWDGKVYTLGHPTQRAKDRYCESLLDAEAARLRALFDRKLITQAKYDDRLETLGGRIDDLEHKTGGPLWREYSAGDKFLKGLHLFVLALFREHHDDLTAATVREMFEGCPALIRLAIRRVIPNFFDWIAEALKVPRDKFEEMAKPVMAQMETVLEQMEAELARPGG